MSGSFMFIIGSNILFVWGRCASW